MKNCDQNLRCGAITAFVAVAALGLMSCSSESTSGDSNSQQTDTTVVQENDLIAKDNSTSSSPDSTTEINIAGGNDPEDFLMPNVLCMNLQEAQNEIQDHGVFYSRSEDATGRNRGQWVDSNWIVVKQSPAPGTKIGEGEALLSAVKIGEPTGGVC